jgi:hypothetical protein
MSSLTTEKYDPVKLERLKHFLETNAERGKPRYFEIFVDNLKAVDKNNDPGTFDDYTMYLNDDSKIIKVLIYTCSETSPRNDKFVFAIVNETEEKKKIEKQNQELSGIEVQTKIDSAINAERERNQSEQLKKELESTKVELEQAEEYIETLEGELTVERNKKHSWKELNLGNVASIAIEEVVKRNPAWMQKIPLLGALSGLAETETIPTNSPDEGNVSFKRKTTQQQPNEKAAVQTAFFQHMEEIFTEMQLQKVMEIINAMIEQNTLVDTIHELIYQTPENK